MKKSSLSLFTLILIITFHLSLYSTSFSQQGWQLLNPTPTIKSYSNLTMFSESSGICQGDNNIFRTYDSGRTWNEHRIINADYFLNGFSLVDSSIGYAIIDLGYLVTDAKKLFKTTNGGVNWNFISQIIPDGHNGHTINFISESIGIISDYQNETGKILKTTNGGINWSESYSESNFTIRNINFISSSVGFAIGENSQLSYYRTRILKTTNAGSTWDSIPSIKYFSGYNILFLNESTGFLSGASSSLGWRILRTTNGGASWLDTLKYKLTDIRFFNNNSGYFLANDTIIGRTTNAGANWSFSKIRNQTVNYIIRPVDLYFINQTTAITIGTMGLNLRTTDNGSTWINYNNSFTSEELGDIVFKNANTGFIMAWSRNIYKTTNAGGNWAKYTLGNTNTDFGAIEYAGANTWYLTDYYNPVIYKTTNDGAIWDSIPTYFSGVTDLQFLNENTGFGVCKYSVFVKTTNGGINWFMNNTIGSQNFTVNFIDEYTGYVGGSRLKKTTNGGITFDTIPRSIITTGWDVKFINRDTIFVSGNSRDSLYDGGAVWKSINGGVNWSVCNIPDINLYGPLRFPNAMTGYVGDGYGTMFKSTNGGNNWFKISSPPYIIGMNFINAETGYAVGNYGIVAKTTDGGTSVFINEEETIAARQYKIYQNYPNPFNPSTKIKFELPFSAVKIPVKIIIFDILGRKMETLLEENLSAGIHEVSWNAVNYSAGVYFYTLVTDGFTESKKMILIK